MSCPPALRLDTRPVPSPSGATFYGHHTRQPPHLPRSASVLQIHLAAPDGVASSWPGLAPTTLSMFKLSHAAHFSVHMTFPFHPVYFKLSSLSSDPAHPIYSDSHGLDRTTPPPPFCGPIYPPKNIPCRPRQLPNRPTKCPPRHRLHRSEDLGQSERLDYQTDRVRREEDTPDGFCNHNILAIICFSDAAPQT